MSKVQPIPEGYHTLTPYLVIKGAAKAIDYYTAVFGAKELFRMPSSDGKIMHAELQIGSSRVMLADEMGEWKGPDSLQGSPVSMMIYVEDVDQVFERAVKAGASTIRPVENQFWGDRMGVLKDPFGHIWSVATQVEKVSETEMQNRMKEMHKQ